MNKRTLAQQVLNYHTPYRGTYFYPTIQFVKKHALDYAATTQDAVKKLANRGIADVVKNMDDHAAREAAKVQFKVGTYYFDFNPFGKIVNAICLGDSDEAILPPLQKFLSEQGEYYLNLTPEATQSLTEVVVTLIFILAAFYGRHKAEAFAPLTMQQLRRLLSLYAFLLIFVVTLLPLNMPDKIFEERSLMLASVVKLTDYLNSKVAQTVEHVDNPNLSVAFSAIRGFNDVIIKPLEEHLLTVQLPAAQELMIDTRNVLGDAGVSFLGTGLLLNYALGVTREFFRFNPAAPITTGLRHSAPILALASFYGATQPAFEQGLKALEDSNKEMLVKMCGILADNNATSEHRSENRVHGDGVDIVASASKFVDEMLAS
jgi:hypothetical protein